MERTSGGFSLLEVLIASIIMVGVVLMTYNLWIAASDTADVAALSAELLQRGRTFVDEVLRDLSQAKVTNVGPANDTWTLQIPVDHDGDGDIVDANGAIEWGYTFFNAATKTITPMLGYTATYSLVEESVLDEVQDKMNYNSDMDKVDVLSYCRIEKEVFNQVGMAVAGSRVVLSKDIVVNRNPKDEDANGDGTPDPFFLLKDATGGEVTSLGESVTLNVWHGRRFRGNRFHMRLATTEIQLRNAKN